MNANVRNVPPPPPPGTRPPWMIEREAFLLKRIAYFEKALSLANDDSDDARKGHCYAQLGVLHEDLAHVREPLPTAGHDGRPQVMREPLNRTAGEIASGMIEEVNINVDRLEEYAHVDEKFAVIGRLAGLKNSKQEPLISQEQWDAGRKLQRDFMLMRLEPSPQGFGAIGGGCSARDLADAKCDAFNRYGDAMNHVGRQSARVLEAIVIDDRDLRAVATGWGLSKHAMVPMLRGALDALVSFYGKPKRTKRPATREHPYHPYHGER